MKVIHVLRKPLTGTVAANVLAHGTGALNIDATRIPVSDNEPDSGAMFYRNRGMPMPENRQNYFGGRDVTVQCEPIPGGRWPANFILQHDPSCSEEGCGAECPIATLDEQSGVQKSGIAIQRNGGGQRNGHVYAGAYKGLVRADAGFGDTGGATRYFKRVASHQR